jgi:Predicted dehydrogenases and related proteins
MSEKTVHWGVIAPGRIAAKFAEALSALAKTNDSLCCYAAASRTPEKAAEFAQQWGFETSYSSYEALFADPAVDAVYIASPHPFHAELSMQALRAGKHVLCEKPAAMNSDQLRAVLDCASDNHLFFMEAMWTAFNPAVLEALGWIRAGRIGTVVHTDVRFCFRNAYDPSSRLFDPALGGGALLDVGIYPVTFSMLTAKAAEDYAARKPEVLIRGGCTTAVPRKIVSDARIVKNVDTWNSITESFASGMTASLQSAVDMEGADSPKDAFIYGTDGYIHLPLFWMAQKAELFAYSGKNGSDAERIECAERPFRINGYEYEIEEAASCILAGRTESAGHGWQASLSVCSVLDALRAQWHLVYPCESAVLSREPDKPVEKTQELTDDTSVLTIYTDGGCSGNPGPGGWGCVILDDGKETLLSGGEKSTTNNRMELMAAISALSAAARNPDWKRRTVKVFSDSQYVKNGITSWITTWKKNGWLTSAKKPVMNRELWEELDELYSALTVEWSWVKGHAGVKYNELCDELCRKEILAQR